MNKAIFAVIAGCLLAISVSAEARGREPCSGRKGGIAYCSGSKFVCRDGSISQSRRICSGYARPATRARANNGNRQRQAVPQRRAGRQHSR
ncbi:hypothetical protein [Eikenella sp. Marseille-P7795]|uniref:hypothetical protein n=1 Tax=Eikenella sp. Marseille-P7795 TaxID=2866577 RepID=UPI001CE47699|nr:hypothetical protein [Eikenella sp. Marseille-P7795]